MNFKTGTVLLLGLMGGIEFGSLLESFFRDRQVTALQVVHCSKADKAGLP